jgi:hypothetical protein
VPVVKKVRVAIVALVDIVVEPPVAPVVVTVERPVPFAKFVAPVYSNTVNTLLAVTIVFTT